MFHSILSFVTAHMNRCIDGIRAGDRNAADELVRRAQDRFRRLAVRMYRGFPNVKVVAEADDLIVDGWMKLLRTLKQRRPENTRQFFVLAGVVIRSELMDLARKARSAKYHARPLVIAGGDGEESSGFPVVSVADQRDRDLEQWELFHRAVGELPNHLQEVMLLLFYDGRTQAETAAILGLHERTVRRRWELACHAIRGQVRDWAPPAD